MFFLDNNPRPFPEATVAHPRAYGRNLGLSFTCNPQVALVLLTPPLIYGPHLMMEKNRRECCWNQSGGIKIGSSLTAEKLRAIQVPEDYSDPRDRNTKRPELNP